jgi:hypothetical protein
MGNSRDIGCFPIQTPAAAIVSPRYCTILFLLFGWLRTQLKRREHNEKDELYEIVDKTLTGLSVEMIEPIFVDGMNRLKRLIDGNVDYVSSNITSECLN